MNLNSLSRVLYGAARASRDINALTRGPGAIARRVVRKAAYRGVNGQLARVLNKVFGGK